MLDTHALQGWTRLRGAYLIIIIVESGHWPLACHLFEGGE